MAALNVVLVAYLAASAAYIALGLGSRSARMHIALLVLLKCLPVLILLFYLVAGGGGTLIVSPVARPVTRPLDSDWRLIFASLLFSLAGDALLVFKRTKAAFIGGIAAFSAAQVCNIQLLGGLQANGMWPGIFVAILSTTIYLFVLIPNVKAFIVLPSFIYTVLLSIVLWRGLVVLLQLEGWSSGAVAMGIGAISYYISDLTLGVHLFAMKVPLGDYLIMVTYYIAQILLFLSVYL